jgi:hypothetical protein
MNLNGHTHGALVVGLVAVGLLAGAANSGDIVRETQTGTLTLPVAAGEPPAVLRDGKRGLLVGAHVDGYYTLDGISRLLTDTAQRPTAKGDRLENRQDRVSETQSLGRSSDSTWRRTVYLSHRLGAI